MICLSIHKTNGTGFRVSNRMQLARLGSCFCIKGIISIENRSCIPMQPSPGRILLVATPQNQAAIQRTLDAAVCECHMINCLYSNVDHIQYNTLLSIWICVEHVAADLRLRPFQTSLSGPRTCMSVHRVNRTEHFFI